MAKNGRRFSPWLLVGVAVVAIVLFGVGGGLISAFEGCIVNPYTTVCNYGTYYAGLGFLSLGSLCSFSWFVLLIIFLVSRPPPPVQYNLGTGFVNGGNFGAVQQPQPQPQPQPYTQSQQYYGGQVQYPAPVVPAAPSKEAYTTIQPSRQNAPAPPYPLVELESTPVPQPQQHTNKICGYCEAVVTSPVCQRCGSAVTTA